MLASVSLKSGMGSGSREVVVAVSPESGMSRPSPESVLVRLEAKKDGEVFSSLWCLLAVQVQLCRAVRARCGYSISAGLR